MHTSLLQRTRFATSDVDVVLCKLVLNDLSFTKIYFQGTKLDLIETKIDLFVRNL